MKKTLTEQYVENLLSEATENELLDAHFERERLKIAFKKRLQQTRRKQQYRLVGRILVVIAAIAGSTCWYFQNTKKTNIPQKVVIPSSEPVAALIQKTIANDKAKYMINNNVLMDTKAQQEIVDVAKTAFENNDFAKAAAALSEISPRNGNIWYYLGFSYMHTGEAAKAIDCFAKAIPAGCNPNFKENIDWWTILLLVKQRDIISAKVLIEKLPTNHYARKNKDVEILLSQME